MEGGEKINVHGVRFLTLLAMSSTTARGLWLLRMIFPFLLHRVTDLLFYLRSVVIVTDIDHSVWNSSELRPVS